MNWKDDEDKVSRELIDARDCLVEHLTTTCGLLTLAIGVVMAEEASSANQPDTQVLKPLLHSLYASTRTLRQLSKPLGMQIRDCYPIARGLSETIVNTMLTMAKGSGPAEQMLAHSRQRAFRDHCRTTAIAGMTITTRYAGVDLGNPPPQIAADLQRFTSKKGRELPWTDLSVAQRIDAIAHTYPQRKFIGLAQTVHWLYPVASEMLHGSLYGWLQSAGFASIVPEGSDTTQAYYETFLNVLLYLAMSFEDLFWVFAKRFSRTDFEEAQANGFKQLIKADYFQKIIEDDARSGPPEHRAGWTSVIQF